MHTEAKFKKVMKETGFVEKMKDVGFTLASDHIWFYRKREDFIDCITLQLLAAGKGVRLHISVLKFDMYPDYDESTFPKDFSRHVTNTTRKHINKSGVGFSSGSWDTSGVGRTEKTLNEISSVIKMKVVPWFDAIDSNQKLYDSIFEDYKTDGEYEYLLD